MDIAELNELYKEADECDNDLFAEQRSNVLLVSGNHYARRGSRFFNTLRRTDSISKEQKIRLTKNHIHRISKTYVNNLLSAAPGILIGPRNESELSDQKAAELNNSVWQDLRQRHSLDSFFRYLAHDYIDIGEAICKIFFDPNAGHFLGYEPVLGEDGLPKLDEQGEPVARPKFSGDLVFERVLGFNFLRDPQAKSPEEWRWTGIRKMVAVKDLKDQFKEDEDKLAFIQESSKQTYQVFDGSNGSYKQGSGMVMVREFYFKPNAEYGNGYYYITVEGGILYEGEIPLGIYPIRYCGFDSVPTYARSYSIIKQLRPYQAEINRAASKMAEHQITLGDDKLILQNGGTISPGGTAHGIKAVKVTGQMPQILAGRTGEQFLGYMNAQISEMYQIANIVEDSIEEQSHQDPYTALFRNIREKKKFSLYATKWGRDFSLGIAEDALSMAKAYFPAEMMIPVFGKKELVNIPEWKATDKLCYQIKLDETSDDVESKVGKQLSLNHVIQYAGQNMEQSDLGKLIRAMPYINKEETLSDLTIDYDNATNDILAMDRGQMVPASVSDNHDYYIKRLTHRTKQADFRFLPPMVQRNYQIKLRQHEQFKQQQVLQAQMAASGFIPTGGYLVACDLYVPDARDPSKMPKRARVPFEALQWLLKKLEAQGTTQAQLQMLPPSAIGDMTRMGLGRQLPMGAPPMGGQGVVPPQQTLNVVAESAAG